MLGLRRALILLFLPAIVASPPARGASDRNPDWPCIQPKVPVISAGMVWAGPEVEENGKAWRDS
ncbi:MAG: hypothetical protein ACE5DS_08630, partial [Kiloniellaceae bacterium]